MTLRVVTGGAGTGKTTRLLALVDEWLDAHPLREGQRVLALTFMHGSRVRLSERLYMSRAGKRFDCVTFDSFARELCTRWSTRMTSMGIQLPSDDEAIVFDATCEAGASLLADPSIARWIVAAHPLIVVDEFQDCRGARPKLIEHLAAVADVLVAADPFQDLSTTGPNDAMEMIARSQVTPEELTHVHRTKQAGLLTAATALRNGQAITGGPGLSIKVVPTHHLAALHVCQMIADSGRTAPVVLSAARPAPRSFTQKVLTAAAATKGYGRNKNIGPYAVPWENSPETYRVEVQAAIGKHSEADKIEANLPPNNPLSRGIIDWLDRERRLRGRTSFEAKEVDGQIGRAEAAFRAVPRRARGRRALTIHQAKNREFPSVIILWGFEVPADNELRRRLLYNAITRARDAAWLIVQDPNNTRLQEPPFA